MVALVVMSVVVFMAFYLQLLHCGRHFGHLAQVGQDFVAGGALAERPQVGQALARNTASLVRDSDDDVLLALADGHLDRRRRLVPVRGPVLAPLVALGHGLHRVAQQLADDVLEMAQDVREVGVEVAFDADLGQGDIRPVGALQDVADGLAAARDDVFGDALEEDLADELRLGQLGTG